LSLVPAPLRVNNLLTRAITLAVTNYEHTLLPIVSRETPSSRVAAPEAKKTHSSLVDGAALAVPAIAGALFANEIANQIRAPTEETLRWEYRKFLALLTNQQKAQGE
jgi:hypothetical protein